MPRSKVGQPMNPPPINADLRITPLGMLRSDDGLFLTGNGTGLIALIQAEFGDDVPGKLYFRKLFSDYIRKLAAFGEPDGRDLTVIFEQSRPNESETGFLG